MLAFVSTTEQSGLGTPAAFYPIQFPEAALNADHRKAGPGMFIVFRCVCGAESGAPGLTQKH